MEIKDLDLTEMTVNELTALRNKLDALIESKKEERVSANLPLLLEEVANLLDGVGRGYTVEDYYAPARYYSAIEGVKNVRIEKWSDGVRRVVAKVTSPVGETLPETIELRGVVYSVVYMEGQGYSSEVDY